MDASSPNGLFRTQAVSHASNRLLGKVLVKPHISASLVSTFLLVWLIAAGVWLSSAQYAKQVTVRGWLEPATGASFHYASLQQGIVSDMYVNIGEEVQKGQALMRLKAERRNLQGYKFNHLLREELRETRQILQSEQQRVISERNERERFLHNQQTQLSKEKDSLFEVVASTKEQYQLAKKHSVKIAKLHKNGWVSDIDLNAAISQSLQLKTQLNNLERERVQIEREADSLAEQLALLPSTSTQTENQLRQQIAEINQRIIRLESEGDEVIFAQSSGKVSDIYASVGQSTTGSPLLTIVPNNGNLIAVLPVPSRSAGFIEQGQSLTLRYDAFPHEKFGAQHGEIESISESILLPNQVPNAATALSEPVYLVRAKVDSHHIHAYGEPVVLKSGNTFAAEIALGERSMLEWLFAPLLSLKGRL